jgi:adenylate cyclase
MEAPPLERKLIAILAADVEGYSRLMHADEEATLAILTSHRSIVDDLIGAHRGHISGTAGDSVLAEFASVTDAFRCAVAIQQSLARANQALPKERRMHLRIGLNVGDVMVKDGDIFGDGVNIAARLETLAEPGGICVTRGVRDHLRDRVDNAFEDLGEHSVKNIARPIRVFRVAFDPMGEPAPAPEPGDSGADRPALTSGNGTAEAPGADAIEMAFWQSAEAGGQKPEYEAYLERYPDGFFAPLARARLEAADEPAPPPPEAVIDVELTFWNSVKDSDNPAMLHAYLDKYPDGEFRMLAEIRLQELEQSSA